jgi:DNA polymerase elongation subunit (family B)
MGKLRGWLLDVYPNYGFNYMTSWIKLDAGGVEQLSERFDPQFYVYGTKDRLRELTNKLANYPEIKRWELVQRRINIDDQKLYEVLEVTMRDYKELKPCAAMIDREGKYAEFQLFNADLRLSQKYMLRHKVFPLAHVEVGSELTVLDDDQFSMDYSVPELIGAKLDIKVNKCGRIVTYDDPVGEISIGDTTLTDRSEPEILLGLVNAVSELDPDIIYTTGGDSFVVPYLYHRAEVNEINSEFQLGRESDEVHSDYVPSSNYTRTSARDSEQPKRPRPEKRGKSYFTYGQIRYKPPFYAFKGRIHIDRVSSFIFLESGLYGLIELARLAGIPIQTMSRLSPGTAISSMQVTQALRDGVLVRWKKNVPESFKDAKTLLLADRGGHIFDPLVGVHENVLEIDFASLYPNIISTKNISPETVLCDCCSSDPQAPRVPSTGYHVCRNRRGLIPRVIERIISRRVVHKKRMREENDVHDQRQKVLKWVLVTCFGYTGYRNARFGRIECHESITAYGREILLDAMEVAEGMGYQVLHGIVDSLWLAANGISTDEASKLQDSFSELCDAITHSTGINIEFENYYRWIVFLPNKSTGVGALTRYYGLFDSGEFKTRGIEIRQRSTPKLIATFQQELLDTLATAKTKQELFKIVKTDTLRVIKEYARNLLAGSCNPFDLVFSTRVTRELGGYRVFNDRVAALTQLTDEGVSVHPGETVRYVVLNHNTRDPARRVRVLELMDGDEEYDKQEYLKHLLRAAASILRPFGYTEERLEEELDKSVVYRGTA